MNEDQNAEEKGISYRYVNMKAFEQCFSLSVKSQIACADIILLNKVDIAGHDDVVELERRVRSINPAASVHRTSKAVIDVGLVIGIDAYAAKPPNIEPQQQACDDHSHAHGPHDHSRSTHEDVTSIVQACPILGAERSSALDQWIRMALWEGVVIDASGEKHSVEILRCKGLYALEGGQRFVLQGVRNLYDVTPHNGEETEGQEDGKLVFIGRGLNDEVRGSLRNVLY